MIGWLFSKRIKKLESDLERQRKINLELIDLLEGKKRLEREIADELEAAERKIINDNFKRDHSPDRICQCCGVEFNVEHRGMADYSYAQAIKNICELCISKYEVKHKLTPSGYVYIVNRIS